MQQTLLISRIDYSDRYIQYLYSNAQASKEIDDRLVGGDTASSHRLMECCVSKCQLLASPTLSDLAQAAYSMQVRCPIFFFYKEVVKDHLMSSCLCRLLNIQAAHLVASIPLFTTAKSPDPPQWSAIRP